MSFNDALALSAGLAGYAALVAAVVNALKTFGVIKDGQATNVVTLLQILGVVGVVAANLFGVKLAPIDNALGLVANALLAITAVVAGIGWTKLWHFNFKNLKIPVIGKSFSK